MEDLKGLQQIVNFSTKIKFFLAISVYRNQWLQFIIEK